MDVPTLFASNLQTFSNNAVTDLQYAGLTRNEALSREALQVAAGLFDMWDQRPKRLQDEDWAEEVAVMEAGQDLWTMWSLKEWAQEAPYYKFFSVAMVPGQWSVTLADVNMTDMMEMPLFEEDNKDFETSPVQKPYATSEGMGKRKAGAILGGVNMDSGPSSARPAKVSKTGPGQPSTKWTKALVDISGAHATDKDLVDEGLEGDIAVWVRWSMRALVHLAPHGKRVEFREAEGLCQQCTTAKVADHCWYPQARLPCCCCLNSGITCRNLAGDTARNAQCRARVVRKREKRVAALATQAARASDGNKEDPTAGPLSTTPAALPTLSAEDNGEEISDAGVSDAGILGEPKLEEGDDGAPVAPEVAEGDRRLESARSVWRPTDKPATEFARVTQRVGELRELEAGMADYAAACERECADLRFALLRSQTMLGEAWRQQGVLVEARREAEEALWGISAFK
ncbi:hypothetical protein C0991_002584 [Blastosporella zonata]|nr:hypothetical protein C0991_002584 [Blastosporella zonata]